ncbi:MAG: CoB--CoM heterodisulfide reductase iron-sulfur subunit A family protein [Anaerolineales bacterium]|nr:CoB--CoM heterodisulfide reductase iron-sulfur subunit A family protein [Anaerolineales bacterium]
MPEGKDNSFQTPPEGAGSGEEIRIGVYTCQCGGNISDTFSCDRVAETLENLPGVVVSRTNMAMCSDIGQKMIENDIKENGVNRVVVGACAPALHEETFRNTVARAGLNPYLFYHVGLREQNSWVHKNNPEGAGKKAIQLMKSGIAKVRSLKPLESIKLHAEKHTLVIGGGIAGLQSALNIARKGIRVTLIEKRPFLGGRMAQLEDTFPDNEDARTGLHTIIDQVLAHPLITVHTQAQLAAFSGYVGAYQATLEIKPRGVNGPIDLQRAASLCPIEIEDEFNYGLTKRKAIYMRYPDSRPSKPAIDWENCTRCGECAKVFENISLEEKPETIKIEVGAVVLATGFDLYEPSKGEYGYGEIPEVITLAQLIRLLPLQINGQPLTYNNREIKNIAFIHCVGSRQLDGINEPQPDGNVNDYCSRVCCTAILHVANDLKQKYPGLNIFDLYEDIRTYGHGHEEFYIKAMSEGIRFLRFKGEEPPTIQKAPSNDSIPVLANIKDTLTWDEDLEIPVDLVVLATGMMPAPIQDLQQFLKTPAGSDRFMAEVHPKLRPVETAVPGIVLSGTAQGPMNIQETSAAAAAAAAKVSILLGQGSVELDPFVAMVDESRCNGTGACVEVCTYEDAIALETRLIDGKEVTKAVVTPANCSGCGICVSVCPTRAIDVQGWTLDQYYGMLDAIVSELPCEEVPA